MKKIIAVFTVCICILLLLGNCKHEKMPPKTVQNTDPDSLYAGTRYYFTVPYRFPDLSPSAAADTASMTMEGVQLGRMLFYDKHLSLDDKKSCSTCHQQAYAFSDGSGKPLSTNEFGFTARNAPPIENLAFSKYMFWDGRQPSLAAQAQDASQHELGIIAVNFIAYLQTDTTYVKLFKKAFGRPGTITVNNIYAALQQFEMTLISNNSQYDKFIAGNATLTSSQLQGATLFGNETGDCFHCHSSGGADGTLLFTNDIFTNNGLDSAATNADFPDLGRGAITGLANDDGKFKNPSLRNIALTTPYMRDGRYKTLTQVVNFYSDSTHLSPTVDPLMLLATHRYGKGLGLQPSDIQALVDFLGTLTDTTFITNPAFADPFKH